jgi:three-Cys-motif partner protein
MNGKIGAVVGKVVTNHDSSVHLLPPGDYNRTMSATPESIPVEDDGLVCPTVGRWAEEKYLLLLLYDELFAAGMKRKWDCRVYIDLYAAAGYSRIEGTSRILKGSPMLALSVSVPFDKYIFCEEQKELLDALEIRSKRIAPRSDISYINGSCDEKVEQICAEIPKPSSKNKVLCLCLVDPCDFGLKFATIKRLSRVFTDFVVLLAIGMDANRNYDLYVDGNSPKIDEALGNRDWRQRWEGRRRSEFRQFLALEFSKSMESLGYLHQELHDMKHVRSNEKNLPLYYLAMFTKHPTGNKFWQEVLKYGNDQKNLFG